MAAGTDIRRQAGMIHWIFHLRAATHSTSVGHYLVLLSAGIAQACTAVNAK